MSVSSTDWLLLFIVKRWKLKSKKKVLIDHQPSHFFSGLSDCKRWRTLALISGACIFHKYKVPTIYRRLRTAAIKWYFNNKRMWWQLISEYVGILICFHIYDLCRSLTHDLHRVVHFYFLFMLTSTVAITSHSRLILLNQQ